MKPARPFCTRCHQRSFFFLLLLCIVQLLCVLPDSLGQRRYPNLYGKNQKLSDIPRNAADSLTGLLEFLVEGITSRDPPETSANIAAGTSYDFIVVGAGTAGATIASRLSEIKDASVLLIEAGGEENFLMDVPVLANFLQFSDDLNWQYKTESSNAYCLGMKNHQCNWPRGRVMGGSSVLNYMIATRGNREDYDRWSRSGNYGWSWDEVLPYFKKLETMGIAGYRNDTKYHNVGGPVHTDYVPFHSPIARAFVQAGQELGWKEVDYNGEHQTGFSYIQTTTKNGMRVSSNRAYLQPVRSRGNLFVTKRSLVTRIIIDENRKRAVGVEFIKRNKLIKVWARKEVIVCAGAINSPQLLMLSGVGPEKHLRELGIRVMRNAAVGENLQDHIAYGGLVFKLRQPVGIAIDDMINPGLPYLRDFVIDRKGPLTTPGGVEGIAFIDVDNPKDPADYPNIELFFVSTSIGTAPIFRENLGLDEVFWRKTFGNVDAKYSWTVFPMLLRPKSRGRVLLRNTDPRSHPRIIPNYMNHPEDVRLLVKGVRFAVRLSKTRTMQQYGSQLHNTPISGCEKFAYDSDDYWDCAVRSLTMNIYHYSGTCKMGPEADPTAVVNPRLQVIGIGGLRVADASIMPEIPTGHTNIPSFMIGEKLADMVKQDWGYPTDPLP